ncbi:MAG TPA: ABC transporter substrate-binding protein [Acidimicrobiales bacterium]|nr:ABC transporter substrate-binding protein [Acidimicrobiales bacterium]
MRTMRAVLVAVATLSVAFSACGKNSSKNELKIGSDIEYAPNEFFKEGTQVAQGFDVDLGNALAKQLGKTAKFIDDTDFAGIIGAMNSGRFDIVMSSMTDTKVRQKSVDFVDYFIAGSSILVQKGNPKGVKTVDDLCGQTVAVQKGTTQDLDILTPQVNKCQASGKALNVLRFEKDTDALQQVKLGRAVADFEDFPVAAYNAKTSGGGNDFEVVGQQIGSAPYGIAVPKKNPNRRDNIQKALKTLIANGTYDRILAKWSLTDGALKTAAINGGA